MRLMRPAVCLAFTLGTSFLSACSGSGSLPSSPSSASENGIVSIPRDAESQVVLPATSPATEQLLVLHENCLSLGQDGNCSGVIGSMVARWQLASGTPLSQIPISGQGGAQFMAVSADDRYVLSYDQTNGVEVDSTSGSQSILVPPSVTVTAIAPSTDAHSDLIVENNTSKYDIFGYREPYTSSYGHVSIPAVSGSFDAGFATAANLDGSQAFVAQRNGASTQVSVADLSTGSLQTTAFPESKGEIPCNCRDGFAYDARHQWFYFFSSTDGTIGAINRVQIFSTKTHTYLGYLNLPFPGNQFVGLTLNENNSDLYVQVQQRVYVYNVGSCGCAKVLRSFAIPGYAGGFPSLDRSGTHLFTQGSDPANQYTDIVYDFNPQTGVLQHAFTVAHGSAGFPDFTVQTIAQ